MKGETGVSLQRVSANFIDHRVHGTVQCKSKVNVIVDGQIPVLPGDFDENGVVLHHDLQGIENQVRGSRRPTIFGDINGDGVVNEQDVYTAARFAGSRLP